MSTDVSKIDDVLRNNMPDRHSFFQLKYFVIGKEPTTQGKMWQCLRELRSRSDALASIDLEIENSKDQMLILALDVKDYGNGMFGVEGGNEARSEIQIRMLNRQIKALSNKLKELDIRKKNTEEESTFFKKAFISLNEVEEFKDFDDPDAQLEYWNAKISQNLGLRQILRMPPDSELITTALALPDDAAIKKETVYMIEQIQASLLEQKAQLDKNKENESKTEDE